MNIDFSSLSQPVTKEDIDAYTTHSSLQGGGTKIPKLFKSILITLLIVTLMTVLLAFVFSIINGSVTGGYGFVPLFVFGGAMALAYALYTRYRRKQLAKLYRFAVANKAHLVVELDNPNYAGTIFETGDSRVIKEALLFSDGKEIGNYSYTTGSGKNRSTHTWGYMRVKLTRRLPHMLLDAKNNNFLGNIFSNLPTTFTKDQTMRLEGNFNDYFTLYAPKGYERDALYVFTPDVMSTLIDFGSHYDMEVIDDNLLFYTGSHYHLTSEESLREALGILDKISAEILDQSDYYADARTGNRAANIVAEPGRRLKSRFNFAVVVIIVLIMLYQIFTVFGPFLMYSR